MVPRDQRIPSQDYSSSPGCSGWVWLETGSRFMDILGRMSTRDQRAPSPSTGAGRKCDLRARMFDVRNLVPQFEVSFCTLFTTPQTGSSCFRLFCYSMGAIISLFSLVSIFKTCVYILICFRFIWKQRGGGSLLSLVLKN